MQRRDFLVGTAACGLVAMIPVAKVTDQKLKPIELLWSGDHWVERPTYQETSLLLDKLISKYPAAFSEEPTFYYYCPDTAKEVERSFGFSPIQHIPRRIYLELRKERHSKLAIAMFCGNWAEAYKYSRVPLGTATWYIASSNSLQFQRNLSCVA